MYMMVSLISLWKNILCRIREPTFWLQKDIVRCTSRFCFRTIVVPYLCQRHVSACKIKSIFIWRWLCLIYQHRDIEDIEKQLKSDFENVCDLFVHNKLSIHFGEDKTKSILFASKRKIKSARKLNVKYKNTRGSRNYVPPILVPSSAKRIATQILVIAKLNAGKDFTLIFCLW